MKHDSTAAAEPTSSKPRGRAARTLALSVLAAGAATALAAAVATTPPQAQADPGDTTLPVGSSQLLQSEDLASIQLPLDTETVRLGSDPDFSSCIGTGSSAFHWTRVLQGSPKPVTATWSRRGHYGEALTELVAQAPDEAKAKQWEATLIDSGIRACHSSKYDFHYGALHREPVGAGQASWALLHYGNHTSTEGGVVVIRKGTNVGFVQVDRNWGDAGQTMESVAKVAVDRLPQP